MLIIFGKTRARIARYIDGDHICYPCRAFDREVLVFQEYVHLCLIPVFPVGGKIFEMRCRNCGDQTCLETVVRKYDRKTRPPFYLYSALILFVGLTAFWFYWDQNRQKEKRQMIAQPEIGDVYLIRRGENSETPYYFLRIAGISGDSVLAYSSSLEYGHFVSSLADEDYFVKEDTLVFTKKSLGQMLERNEINTVRRSYGEGSGFNRIK
jgi:hypothetical protein